VLPSLEHFVGMHSKYFSRLLTCPYFLPVWIISIAFYMFLCYVTSLACVARRHMHFHSVLLQVYVRCNLV
jgi:hypothetical protein